MEREDSPQAKETWRLWRVWRTLHQMLLDRGYNVSREMGDMSLEQFQAEHCSTGGVDKKTLKFTAKLVDSRTSARNMDASGKGIDNTHLYVEYADEDSVGVKTMRGFVHFMQANGIRAGILISKNPLTPSAQKIIGSLVGQFVIEHFLESHLLVNITHHELVPQHIVLSFQEKAELLEKYKLTESQLPRIQAADPVARYYGMKRGQVCKIIRKSETSGRYASYRICW